MIGVNSREPEYPTGPFTIGVSGVAVEQNRVLLVKISYGHRGWMLPGGYARSNETVGEAIRREMLEETGLTVEPVEMVSIRSRVRDRRNDVYITFRVKVVGGELKPDGKEVVEARYFTLKEMMDRADVPKLNLVIAQAALNEKKTSFTLSEYKPEPTELYELWF